LEIRITPFQKRRIPVPDRDPPSISAEDESLIRRVLGESPSNPKWFSLLTPKQGLALIEMLFAVDAMAPESMDSSRSSNHFTAVHHAAWDEILLTWTYWNAPSVDDEGVTALHDKDVFVIFMRVLGRPRILEARPKCHLASIFPIKDIAFNAGRCLIRPLNSVCRILHEIRESVHPEEY
jgi:hypothetical protein